MPPNPDENILWAESLHRRRSFMITDEDSFESNLVRYQQQQQSAPTVKSPTKSTKHQVYRTCIFEIHLNAWLRILQYLPLSQVLELPLVCREFRDKVFNIPEFWKEVYLMAMRQSTFSAFIPNAPLWDQGLILRRWFTGVSTQICDHCYAGFGVNESHYGWLSVQPVRILLNRKSNSIRRERYSVNLCGPCRVFHYQLQPEPFCLDNSSNLNLVSQSFKSNLLKKYALNESDIGWISPQKLTEAFVHIYARVIFGGEVGIEAERKRGQIKASTSIATMAQLQVQKMTAEAGF